MEIEAKKARKNLISVWLFGGLILLFIFIIQHLFGKFEDQGKDAWLWISPNLFPILGLVTGSYILGKKRAMTETVDTVYYLTSIIGSLFYIVVLFSVILTYPLSNKSILEHYKDSNIFLVPIQTIINGTLGVFFINNQQNENQ